MPRLTWAFAVRLCDKYPFPMDGVLLPFWMMCHKLLALPHDKTSKMAGVSSKDSDQPGHLPNLIRVFTVHMKKTWVLSYPLSAQQRLWLDWADAQADLSLRWVHSHCVGFVMRRLTSWTANYNVICICVSWRDSKRKFEFACHCGWYFYKSVYMIILCILFDMLVSYLIKPFMPSVPLLGPWNSADQDQMLTLQNAASDQVLHCLHI